MSSKIKKINKETRNIDNVIFMVQEHLSELLKHRDIISESMINATASILIEIRDTLLSIVVLYPMHFKTILMAARHVLEGAANLIYIYQEESEKRALNFWAFSAVKTIKALEDSGEEYSEDDESLLLAKRLAKQHAPRGKKSGHWDGLSIKEVMFEANLGEIHRNYYRRLSTYSHTYYKGQINFDSDGIYTNFMKDFVSKDLPFIILQALQAVNQRYDLLNGSMIIRDYPKKDAILHFSINKKYNTV